jgi:hypothetical protein
MVSDYGAFSRQQSVIGARHVPRRRGGRVAARGAREATADEFLISLGRNDRANLAQAFRRGLSE